MIPGIVFGQWNYTTAGKKNTHKLWVHVRKPHGGGPNKSICRAPVYYKKLDVSECKFHGLVSLMRFRLHILVFSV